MTQETVLLSSDLLEHKTGNYTPICRSPENPDMALYVPKTAIDFQNLKRTLDTPHKQQKLLQKLNYILNLSIQERGEYLESLTEVKKISAKECQQQKWPDILIGQKGLYARKDIPAFTPLGFYAGLYFIDRDMLDQYADSVDYKHKTYMFSLPDVSMPRISAFMYGNDLSYANACTNYSGTAYHIAQQIFYKRNTVAVYVKSSEYPDPSYVDDAEKFDLVSFVVKRDVKKGEQFLFDYGYDYWEEKNPDFTTATDDEIDEEFFKIRRKHERSTDKKHIK